jgi:uncharacterized protein YkwD
VDGDDIERGTITDAGSRRVRSLLPAALVLVVLIGGGLYLTRGVLFPGPAAGRASVAGPRVTAAGCGALTTGACAGSPAPMAVAAPPAVVKVPPRPTGTSPSATASAGSRSPRPTASVSATTAVSTSPPVATDGTAAAQVLAVINQARAGAGLPALTVTSGLEASSSGHNMRMAGGCGLSHQCPGEPSLGDRETAAGVHWTAAGENIGEGGPVADTQAAIAQMAVGLTQDMLNEKPPNDGHRLNILSSTFTHIGIAVYRDNSGTVWLTQDFSN